MNIKKLIAQKYIEEKFGLNADFALLGKKITISDSSVYVLEMLAKSAKTDLPSFIENRWSEFSGTIKFLDEKSEQEIAKLNRESRLHLVKKEMDFNHNHDHDHDHDEPVVIDNGEIVRPYHETFRTKESTLIPGKTRTALHRMGIPSKDIERIPFIFSAGVFRNARHPDRPDVYDDRVVHHLLYPIDRVFNVVRLKGEALNAGLDLYNYICLSYHLGRMTEKEYYIAQNNDVIMDFEDFYSPMGRDCWPNPEDSNIIDASFSKLQGIVFKFYHNEKEANLFKELKGGPNDFLLANITTKIRYIKDKRTIIFNASPQFKHLYQSSRTYEINRKTLSQSKASLVKLLMIWAASPMVFSIDKEGWKLVDLKPISIKELLDKINPKEKYTSRDIDMLGKAIQELELSGLIYYDIKKRNKKIKNDNSLTLASMFCLIKHRLANKESSFDKVEKSKISLRKIKSEKDYTPTGKKLIGIKYPQGQKAYKDEFYLEWYRDNLNNIDDICNHVKSVYNEHGVQAARLIFVKVHMSKLRTFHRCLSKHNHPAANIFSDICNQSMAQIRKDAKSISPELDLAINTIRKIPLKKTRQDPVDWLKANRERIIDSKDLISSILKSGGYVNAINKAFYKARLIDPVRMAGDHDLALFFKDAYEKEPH